MCPFHKEKTPSFTVAPDKQIFKCFGCWIGWNAIKFVMEYEKIDFIDALKLLAQEAGIDLNKLKQYSKTDKENISQKEKYLKINILANKFFQENLKQSEKALNYLKKERKLSDEIINTFELGYAPDSFYKLIDYLKNNWFETQDIIKLWLAKQGSNDIYSFFRNRIIFPIYDHMGNLVAFAGRIINPEDSPKYLNTPETILYDKSKILYGLNIAKNYIKEFEKIIIVEGYMDVIALYRGWFPIWVATCGTALSTKHIKLLKRYTENIVFAFDNDEAGLQATIRWLKIAFENEIYPKSLILPDKYKDLDEFINDWQKLTDDLFKDSFQYVLEKLSNIFDLSSPIDKKKFLNQIFDILFYLYKNDDLSILDFYINIAAKYTNISLESVKTQFFSYLKNQKKINKFEEINKQKQITYSNEEKISALILNEFYKNFDKNNILENIIIKLTDLIEFIPQNNILYKTIFDNLNLDEKEKLKQIQLLWEKHLEEKKALDILKKFILNYIINLWKHLIKTQTDIQNKQKINQILLKIRKI